MKNTGIRLAASQKTEGCLKGSSLSSKNLIRYGLAHLRTATLDHKNLILKGFVVVYV